MAKTKRSNAEKMRIAKMRLKYFAIAAIVEIGLIIFFNPEIIPFSLLVVIVSTIRDIIAIFIGPIIEIFKVWCDKYPLVQLLVYIIAVVPFFGLIFSALQLAVCGIKSKFSLKVNFPKQNKKVFGKMFSGVSGVVDGLNFAQQPVKMSQKEAKEAKESLLELRKKYSHKSKYIDKGVYVRQLTDVATGARDKIIHWDSNNRIKLSVPGAATNFIVLVLSGGEAFIEGTAKDADDYRLVKMVEDQPYVICRNSANGATIPYMRITWLGKN